jgi:membrane-associated phospholipid phosphatase
MLRHAGPQRLLHRRRCAPLAAQSSESTKPTLRPPNSLLGPAASPNSKLQQQQQWAPLGVAQPQFLAGCLLAFSLVAADIFAPASLHLLPGLDLQLHQLVLATTGSTWRREVADLAVSDTFITAAMLGWLASSSVALARHRGRALPALAAAWAFYCYGAGAVLVDPALVDWLKHAFHRCVWGGQGRLLARGTGALGRPAGGAGGARAGAGHPLSSALRARRRLRPSTLHHTYSFPSGHTTAAVFTMGALLLVLLPLALADEPREQGRQAAAGGGSGGAAQAEDLSGTQRQQALAILQQVRRCLRCTVSRGCTRAGRRAAPPWWPHNARHGGLLAISGRSACCHRGPPHWRPRCCCCRWRCLFGWQQARPPLPAGCWRTRTGCRTRWRGQRWARHASLHWPSLSSGCADRSKPAAGWAAVQLLGLRGCVYDACVRVIGFVTQVGGQAACTFN